MKQQNRKTPLVFRLGIALLCAMLCTSYLTGSLYARYTSSVTGSSTTRVAKFSISTVNITETDKTLDLSFATEKQSISCDFTVTSDSEVISVDTVTIVLPSTCPTGLELSMTVNGNPIALTTSDSKTYTCSADFDFQETHAWVLTFIGDPDKAVGTHLEGIKISVTVEQKD